ncbi:GGDEF domain-containing protein [Anaerotignum sp.]|uniref:GGDEF domain-containing protein n=1 Tax=Anaerotignum sp. TaxID=2039241 RepID=UPI0028B20CF9|nr:GGDEF domain-containing protein [Anaerotignum sp.]
MKRKNMFLILYVVVIAVLIIVCINAVEFFHFGVNKTQQGRLIEINENWALKQDGEVHQVGRLPQIFFDDADQGTLCRQLPENLSSDSILAFTNRFQDVKVKIGGEERYSYSGLLPNSTRRMNNNTFCIVGLNEGDRGKLIEVTFHSPLKNTSLYLPNFYIGTETGMLLEFLRYDTSSLVFSGIMFFFAILFLAMCIREHVGKKENYNILAHASVLMALSGIWSITNSPIVHLSVQNDVILGFFAFNAFMLLPLAIPIFYSNVLEAYKESLNRLAVLAAANFIIQNILYFIGKFQYIQMMPVTYIISMLSLMALIGISFREHKERDSYYATGFLSATVVFMGFYILDVFRFFYDVPLDNAKYFRYGLLTFIVIILWICAKRMLCYVEVEVENRIYKELALRDVLTQLPNRAALEKRIEGLEEAGVVCKCLTVILMDVNGLKPVNDKSGHGAGDRLLCEAARSIKVAFPEEDDAWYRLGGDEFVVLMTETELDNEECQQRLLKATERWKDFDHGPVSISCGSKTVKDMVVTREGVHRLIHEADQIMYKNKIQYYQKKVNKRNAQDTV